MHQTRFDGSNGLPDDALLQEETLSSERVFEGGLVKVDALEVKLPDGQEKRREVIRHPGAVALIVVDDQGRVLLERQMRTAAGKIITEIPAGKIDAGEDPEHAAKRELEEETGLVAGKLEYIFSMATAIGYSDEIIYFYRATQLEAGERHLDDGEFINTFWMDIDVLYQEVMSGSVYDSKTMVAALLLKNIQLEGTR